jgi:hypothetical protein
VFLHVEQARPDVDIEALEQPAISDLFKDG